MSLKLSESLYEITDGVLIVKWNRPKRKNAINQGMYSDLTVALDYATQNDDIKVVVLTGNGDYYSSGNDLTNFMGVDLSDKKAVSDLMQQSKTMLTTYVDSFIKFQKILIACVNGPSVGVATTQLALCDFVYASETATFHTPFISLAQVPECCSSYTFPKLVGKSIANEILIQGKKFNAKQAKEWGFVNDVFPVDDVLNKTIEFAKDLARQPTGALYKAKSLLRPKEEVDHMLSISQKESEVLYSCWISDDLKIALMNFVSRPRSKL